MPRARLRKPSLAGGAAGGRAAETDAELWEGAARLVERLGDFDWETVKAKLDELDEYLLLNKRSFYCLGDRIRGRPDPYAPIDIESIYAPK